MTELIFPEVKIFNPEIYNDSRGYFSVIYEKDYDCNLEFDQTNISYSVYGVIRGLHYQKQPFEQGKLLYLIHGEINDYQVDIRKFSPTFGKYQKIKLKSKQKLYIPEGFAHGFEVLSPDCTLIYQCTNIYYKQGEMTIKYNDKTINIPWEIKYPIVSEKDKNGITLKELYQ